MKSDAAEQERVREYLLGQLSTGDREQFEEQLLIDSELYEELVISEDELVDEYLRNELSPADRENFESHFAAATERQGKIRFARALKRYVAAKAQLQRSADVIPAAESEGKSRVAETPPKRSLLSFLPFQNPIVSYSLAAAMVVLVVGVGWMAWKNLLSPPRGQGNVLAVTLAPGLQRGEGETKRISIRSDTATVRLQLILAENLYQTYEATVQDSEGSTVATDTNLKATPVNDQRSVFVNLNARLLKRDDYRVQLDGVTPDGHTASVATYSFRILTE